VALTATTGDIGTSVGNPGAWGGVNRTNTITNSGAGKVEITAGNGSATGTGLIDGTVLAIMQNGNGGVIVTTSGTGHVTAPKIINAGTGNVTVAAGTQLASGDGTGGQVKTVSGNTISQTNATPGKTYIYTGNAADTGVLSNLGLFSSDLYLSSIGSNTKNAASNKAYADGSMTDGANAQVMFREKVAFTGVLNDATVTYGSTDSMSLKTALQTANPSGGTPSTFTQNSNAGTLQVLVADVVADSTSTMTTAQGNAANLSSSGHLKASTTGYSMDITGNNYALSSVTAKLKVDKRDATIAATATNVTFNGTTQTQTAPSLDGVLNGDRVTPIGGVATGTAAGTYNNPLSAPTSDDAGNYNWNLVNADLVITPNTTPEPPTPITPIIPPTPNNNTVVVAGGANNFQLAGADGQCSADALEQCECESATSGAGIGVQICYEPNTRPSSAL
jgi:hypothetical protein